MPLTRTLAWPECQNTRDLGGLPARTGTTQTGRLIRSDHVGLLTAEGIEAMEAYGVTTVVDLRTSGEISGGARDLRYPPPISYELRSQSVTYLHVPLIDELRPNVKAAETALERYIAIVEARRDAFGRVLTAIAEADGCVLFHCFAGKDRTGLVAALLLELAGVPREHIAADYGETDRQLARQYEMWLANAAPEHVEAIRDDLSCSADRILGVLDHVDHKWGGVPSYVAAAGVSPANIDRLSSKLA